MGFGGIIPKKTPAREGPEERRNFPILILNPVSAFVTPEILNFPRGAGSGLLFERQPL
jgi:hypothetical protein